MVTLILKALKSGPIFDKTAKVGKATWESFNLVGKVIHPKYSKHVKSWFKSWVIYFTEHTINCVCHSIRSMFIVLGVYNFDTSFKICNEGVKSNFRYSQYLD